MSVAFTREEDLEATAADLPDRPISPHPNLVTPLGLAAIEAALASARAAYTGAQAHGSIEADVTQECVVSLDPVVAHLVIELAVDFVPEPAGGDTELIDPFATAEVEPIENGKLAIGRIVVEERGNRLLYP